MLLLVQMPSATGRPSGPSQEKRLKVVSHLKEQDPILYDMKKVSTTLDQLLECADDQRIAVEGSLQRVASVIVMQDLFSMA